MNFSVLKVLVVTLLMTSTYWAVNEVLGTPDENQLNAWAVVSNLLVVTILYYFRKSIFASKKRVFAYVFIVYFIVGYFNLLLEAYIFDVLDLATTLKELLRGGIMALFLSAIITWWWKSDSVVGTEKNFERNILTWTKQCLTVVILYIVCYGMAGVLVQQTILEFMNFYEDKIPPMSVILLTQVFRGLVFASIIVIIDRATLLPRQNTALLTGAIFAVLGAIAPLIVPNAYMPQYIRVIHGFEVGVSNFAFGVIAYLVIGSAFDDGHTFK